MSFCGASIAQQQPDWSTSIQGVAGIALAVDSVGNSYSLGTLSSNSAMVLTKLGPTGAQLWQQTVIDGSSGLNVATDSQGNALVHACTPGCLGSQLLKYGPNGQLLWSRSVTSNQSLFYGRVGVDASDNAYMVETSSASGRLSKVSASGVVQWFVPFGQSVDVGTLNAGLPVAPNGTALVRHSTGEVKAFDSSGNLVWSRSFVAPTYALSLATGAQGHYYVLADRLVVKFDSAFNEVWRSNLDFGAYFAAESPNGDVAISGESAILDQRVTTKLSATGAPLWPSSRFDGTDASSGVVLALDGSVYASGVQLVGETYYVSTAKYGTDGNTIWVSNLLPGMRNLGLVPARMAAGFFVHATPWTSPSHVVMRYASSDAPPANQAPIAVASASTSAGPAPLTVTLRSTGSSDPDGTLASYRWTLGDGRVSNEASPTVTYSNPGTYGAQLVVSDNVGATSPPAGVTITVNLAPAKPQLLTLASARVKQNSSTTATIALSTSSGANVTLASSNPAIAVVPATLNVPAGASTAGFNITTKSVKRDTALTITATANGASASATLTVTKR